MQSINVPTVHVWTMEIVRRHPMDSIAVAQCIILAQLVKLVIHLVYYIILQDLIRLIFKKIRIHVQAIHVWIGATVQL